MFPSEPCVVLRGSLVSWIDPDIITKCQLELPALIDEQSVIKPGQSVTSFFLCVTTNTWHLLPDSELLQLVVHLSPESSLHLPLSPGPSNKQRSVWLHYTEWQAQFLDSGEQSVQFSVRWKLGSIMIIFYLGQIIGYLEMWTEMVGDGWMPKQI